MNLQHLRRATPASARADLEALIAEHHRLRLACADLLNTARRRSTDDDGTLWTCEDRPMREIQSNMWPEST